jgi:translation elongation factor P/translation initiation factor 5A
MKQLIKMRNENDLCKSLEINFVQDGKNPRFVHYQKIADNGVLDVRLNCSENIETLTISEEVLFSRLYDGDKLLPGGVVISYRKN